MPKKGLTEYRMKIFNLLQTRTKYVDARSYNFFVKKIFSAQTKKLDEIFLTLKNVKKIISPPLRFWHGACYPSGLGTRPKICLESHETSTEKIRSANSFYRS